MLNNDWPGWAKLVAGLGFPIAVATWFMVFTSPRIDRTAQALERHMVEAEIQTALLRAICRNTARTEMQGQFCDLGVPKWGTVP